MRARAIVVLGLVAAALLVAAAPAGAFDLRVVTIPLKVRGSLKVVWHGDRSRGCAAAGLCGYSGTIAYPRRRRAELELDSFGRGDEADLFGFLDLFGRVKVRTKRAVAGGSPAVCSDHPLGAGLTIDSRRAYGHRSWLAVGTDISPDPVASAQCAGPRIDDFEGALPSALVHPHDLNRRGARVSLAGRFPWKSGPLVGEVVSTLKLTSRGAKTRHIHEPEPRRHGRRGHTVYVELEYQARRLEGEVGLDFRAIDAPICRLRDACGTRGSEVYSVEARNQRLDVLGRVKTHSRHKPSLRRALRMIARRGSFSGTAAIDRRAGLTTHAYVRPGAPTCSDSFRPRRGPVLFMESGKHSAATLFSTGPTLLRGRCPGPSEEQSGDGRLARTRISRHLIEHRVIRLDLRSTRRFSAGAYRGKRTVRLAVRMRRTHSRVSVDHLRAPEGRYFVFAFSFSSGSSSGG